MGTSPHFRNYDKFQDTCTHAYTHTISLLNVTMHSMEGIYIDSTYRDKMLATRQRNESISHGKSHWKGYGDSNHTSFLLDNMEEQTRRTDPVNSGEDELPQKASSR